MSRRSSSIHSSSVWRSNGVLVLSDIGDGEPICPFIEGLRLVGLRLRHHHLESAHRGCARLSGGATGLDDFGLLDGQRGLFEEGILFGGGHASALRSVIGSTSTWPPWIMKIS